MSENFGDLGCKVLIIRGMLSGKDFQMIAT